MPSASVHAATYVATLIADPRALSLSTKAVENAAAALPRTEATLWLADRAAADIFFAPGPCGDDRQWIATIRSALGPVPLDVVVQPVAGRRKRLLIADMDSTMIEQECIDELAEAVGLKAKVAAITDRSMRGELDFEQSLMERVGLLRGLVIDEAKRIVIERITMTPGARALVQTMRAHGALTVLASGGFTMFTGHVASRVGFDLHYANTLEVDDGRLTGDVSRPIFGRESKRATLRALRDEFGLTPDATIAVGDGANDLAMLAEAGLGVAFRAKPAVAAAADARIEHGDLTALLYLQGYRASEFVA